MQPLKLKDQQTGETHALTAPRTALGRGDTADIVVIGARAGLTSGLHAEIRFAATAGWTIADLGSTNGTWVNGSRLTAPHTLKNGDVVSLAQRGPSFVVSLPVLDKTLVDRANDPDATVLFDEKGRERTVVDGEVLGAPLVAPAPPASPAPPRAVPPTPPPQPPAAPPSPVLPAGFDLVLRRVGSTDEFRAQGRAIVIGRDPACDIPLRSDRDKIVSSRHAEVRFSESGEATVADAGSRNGTFLGARRVSGAVRLKAGDRLVLGEHGAAFDVVQLGAERASAPAPKAKPDTPAKPAGRPLRPSLVAMLAEARKVSVGGGATMLAVALAGQVRAQGHRRMRWTIGVAVTATVLIVGAVVTVAVLRVREVSRRADAARAELASQLTAASSALRTKELELNRLVLALERARQSNASPGVRDSLLRRVNALRAEQTQLTSAVTAARSLDTRQFVSAGLPFAAAVRRGERGASGVFISSDGYMLTSSAIADADGEESAEDTVWVWPRGRVADPLVAEVVSVEADVVILKVHGYDGEAAPRIDWTAAAVTDGAPVAALGYVRSRRQTLEAPAWVLVPMSGAVISSDSTGVEAAPVGGVPMPGAGVFDAHGALVGVMVSVTTEGQRRVQCVLLRDLRDALPDVVTGGGKAGT